MFLVVLSPLLLLGANPTPRDAERPRIAVLATDRCESGNVAQSTSALREALAGRMGADIQSEEESTRRLGGVTRGSLSDVTRALGAARQDYYQGAWPRAQRALEQALADLESLTPTDGRWELQKQVLAVLAQVHRASGREDLAEIALSQILRVEPHYRPDPDIHPPSFLRLTDRIRTELAGQDLATLTIQTRPAGLAVFVGGRFAGTSPLRVALPHGDYRVEPLFDHRRGLPLLLRLESDAALTIDEAFEGIVWPNAGPCLATPIERSARLDAMARIGAVLEVELVISIREDRLGGEERYLVASAVDVASGQELREGRIKFGTARPSNDAVQRLAEFISTGALHPPVEATRRGTATRRPALGRWASYALGGVGVLVLGGGGTLHYRASESARRGDALFVGGVLPDAQRTRFIELQAQSERERRIGWGLTAGASVALGGAATLFLLSDNPKTPRPVTPTLGPGGVGLSGHF